MADDQGRIDRRTNGEINLEAIARFQIDVDQNPNYCGDRDDDLEFLAKHIDQDPGIFHQYVDILLYNSQDRNIILNPDEHFIESSMSRLRSTGPSLVEDHRSRSHAISRKRTLPSASEEGSNEQSVSSAESNLVTKDQYLTYQGNPKKKKIPFGSEMECNDLPLSIQTGAASNLIAKDHYSTIQQDNKKKEKLPAESEIESWESSLPSQMSGEHDFVTKDQCLMHQANPQKRKFPTESGEETPTVSKKMSLEFEKSRKLPDRSMKENKETPMSRLMHIDHEYHFPKSEGRKNGDINFEAIARFQIDVDKNSNYCGDLDDDLEFLAKHIDEDPKVFIQYVDIMLLYNLDDRNVILNPDEFFIKSMIKKNLERFYLQALDEVFEENPRSRFMITLKNRPELLDTFIDFLVHQLIVNMMAHKLGDEADTVRDSSPYMSDSYREVESHYQTLHQLMKNDPDVLDWVIYMLVEENPEKRKTCATVFDRLKRGTKADTRNDSSSLPDTDSEGSDVDFYSRGKVKMILERAYTAFYKVTEEHRDRRDDLVNMKEGFRRQIETGGASLMDRYMDSLRLYIKENVRQAADKFIEEHPEKKAAIVKMTDIKRKRGQDRPTEEKKVLEKYADGIVSFLNELNEEHPEILCDKSDKDSDKQGGMLRGTLRWISEEPGRFDEYTWLQIQKNPEHGREIARMTDYMKLRAKVMTLQELFEVDPEQFDTLVEEIIQGNHDAGDIVVEEAVDQSQKGRNLKAIDTLMMHLEQNPMYFSNDLIFLLKRIGERPELFDKYLEAIVTYNPEDRDTILYPEKFLESASKTLNILEKHSGNVTYGSVEMALVNDETALFHEYVMSRAERNPTRLKLIATMAEELKLLEGGAVATGTTNSSTVDGNSAHGEGNVTENTRNNDKTKVGMNEMINPLPDPGDVNRNEALLCYRRVTFSSVNKVYQNIC